MTETPEDRAPKVIRPPAGEYYYKCAKCGAWIDYRDAKQVLDHEGPLPHPDEKQGQ